MTIKKFLFFSVAFHIVLFSVMYLVPEPKIKKAREFVTSLVSPQELRRPETPIKPVPRPLPGTAPKPKVSPQSRPAPFARTTPGRQPSPLEQPVVPGEGKEGGKPLPEGKRPEGGEVGKSGDSRGAGELRDKRAPVTPGQPGFSVARSFREITESMGEKNSGGHNKNGKKDNTITFDTEDYRYAGYMRQLRQKIESIWVYPPEAAAKGIYGDLKIQFTIKKDGRLGAIELVRTSGYKMLDDAAMKALKDGEPYWPLPDSWGRDSYTILGHFVYVYGGYYIR